MPLSEEQDANAAVAILLRLSDGEPHILFAKRVQNPRDSWSGQVGLPGGKRDLKDRDLRDTVIRETLEETNIDLLNHSQFLGVMAADLSGPKPQITILPFVILLETEPTVKLNKSELEEYAWISLNRLEAGRTMVKFDFGLAPAYQIGTLTIWGFTYRTVEKFLQLCKPVQRE